MRPAMQSIFFMYDMVSAVRSAGTETEIIHKKSPYSKKKKADRHTAPQSYDEIRQVFMRDCSVLSPEQYIARGFIMGDRPLFLEFQSMDSVHQGESVLLNPSDIMSFGGTSNEGGVYITTFSGMIFVMPAELKAFAFAHEWHRSHGRALPSFEKPAREKSARVA